MIEYKSTASNEKCLERNQVIAVASDGRLSLTKLWEYIVRTKSLPDGFDVDSLYNGVRDKLRDPEREVRQHALRVLIDLIPVTQTLSLDDHMQDLIPELLSNLSHSAPALRKSALDSLRKYLQHSRNYDELLKKLISTDENNVVAAAPFLISPETGDETLRHVIEQLWKDLSNPRLNQEIAAKALARIRFSLGDERFEKLLGTERYSDIQRICDSFGLPTNYSTAFENEIDKRLNSSELVSEDRVILETEITLKTGPAITMKIHEESRPSSVVDCFVDSCENSLQNLGVFEVLEDESDGDFYESARRTPRKVHFGGESVKLRTPESDSSNHDELKGTIRITVTDAISIRTKRSLIPVRITSLPSTPKKQISNLTNYRLHRSTPNLGRDHVISRIPLKKNSNVLKKFNITGSKKVPDKSTNIRKPSNELLVNEPEHRDSLVSSRLAEVSSPIPAHKEIEVFHNLTRSPVRVRKEIRQTTSVVERDSKVDRKKENNDDGLNYSFQLYTESQQQEKEIDTSHKNDQSDEEITTANMDGNASLSFQVCNATIKNKVQETSSSIQSFGNGTLEKCRESKVVEEKELSYNSFQVCHQGSTDILSLASKTRSDDNLDNTEISFDSFQVFRQDSNFQELENFTSSEEAKCEEFEQEDQLHHQWQMSTLISEEHSCTNTEALDNLIKMLKQPNTCETLEPGPAAMLFEALFSCQHFDKLHFLANDALAIMVNGLRVDVVEQCLGRLAIGVSRIGSPSGVSLALLVMKKCQAKHFQTEITNSCFGHKMREGALQILIAAARLLPSSDIEINKIAEFASAALKDRRRRIRQAALETLATLAPLTSSAEVLNIVTQMVDACPDHDHLIRVVRTRLSRRQLPTVEIDGTVRYSSSREQDEVAWLSENYVKNSSASSSASSSNHSVNYWKHNSRHEGGGVANVICLPNKDDGANENQQIWAVDPSVFPRNHRNKNSNKGDPPVLRPIYFLQPEAVTEDGRGYLRHDRGRSFSPPKQAYHKQVRDLAGSALQHNPNGNAPLQFKPTEGFRKSFSSEQLYYSGKSHQDPYSFPSSSGSSSTTSAGSSVKSNVWQREMRSGIPIPITSDTKLRLRTNNNTNMTNNTTVGPVIARSRKIVDANGISLSKSSTPVLAITDPPETKEKSALKTSPDTPITTRLSPRNTESNGNVTPTLPLPPRSSGSESSGYFTPPSNTRAFVKLDSEIRSSESEDKEDTTENDNNNNSQERLDSFDGTQKEISEENAIKIISETNSEDLSDHKEEPVEINELEDVIDDGVVEEKHSVLHRFSLSSSKELSFISTLSPSSMKKNKSKSVVDLQNFLPEIPKRKNTNSAPPLKDDFIYYNDLVITNYEDVKVSPTKTSSEESLAQVAEVIEPTKSPKEITITRKLSRRLSRTPSRRSIKSTPRSVRDLTPKSTSVKPKEALHTALAQLNNQEWEVMIQGLQGLTKLAKCHPDVIEANIHNVCINLGRHIRNLRSQVARSACHTATEIFGCCRKGLDMEFEEIAGPLLHRTADTNKFLRSDANTALDVMCEHLPPSRVITVITTKGCNHQNNIVRSASMRLLTNIVKKLGNEKVFQLNKDVRDRIILAGANSLGDGSLEARNHGKVLFSYLLPHHQFQKVLLEIVPQSTLRHIAKTLSSIKPCSVA